MTGHQKATLRANAFLQHMVRIIVGALEISYVGKGKHPPDWLREVRDSRERAELRTRPFAPEPPVPWSEVEYAPGGSCRGHERAFKLRASVGMRTRVKIWRHHASPPTPTAPHARGPTRGRTGVLSAEPKVRCRSSARIEGARCVAAVRAMSALFVNPDAGPEVAQVLGRVQGRRCCSFPSERKRADSARSFGVPWIKARLVAAGSIC